MNGNSDKEKEAETPRPSKGGAAPFFSLIVSCCDVAQYLHECLDSVLNQPFTDWECLVGVEESKDKTLEIAREYEAKDSRFKVFFGPRTGSCSASRNTAIDMATGEYIIFADGDDSLAEGSLQRLHDKIAERPGADLYPCAVKVHNDITGKDEPTRDNYRKDFNGELTGPEATIHIVGVMKQVAPMMQLTICRRQFLLDNKLKCIHGLRGQDREFSPRALYMARRVVPTHEPFYLYRRREGAITISVRHASQLQDQAIIHKSLLAFHAKIHGEAGFDERISVGWSQSWLNWMFPLWFWPWRVSNIPRSVRYDTLRFLFSDGFDDFNLLLKHASLTRRIAGWWFRLFVKRPRLQFASELFFRCYFRLSERRKG